jgi:hypothetical protein
MSLRRYWDKGECAEGWDLKNGLKIKSVFPDSCEICFAIIVFVPEI